MTIFIDTDTFADAPAVYADAEKTQALPRVLPLVQGFKGTLRVGFLGSRAPSQSARAIFAARPLGAKTDVVQTPPGAYVEAGGVPAFAFNITADTTQLAEALGDKEALAMRAGIVVEEESALCKPARSEWQLTLSASATALGGDQPEPRPSEADELRSEIAAEAACRAAADAELASELRAEIAAETACRKSELLRVDSKFSETACALGELSDELGEKADAADAVLLAAADSAEKNAASKHGKAALITVDGGDGGVYISGLAGATRADEKWIAKARHDGVRVFRAPGAAPENFGYYAGACFCAGDVFARAKDVACSRADVCRAMAEQRDALRSEIAEEAACRVAADAALCARICAVEISAGGGISAACVDAKIAAEAACRAAADAEALDALDAESACRKSEILRVDSNFSELSDAVGELMDALGEKADAADAVLLAAADSAEKNAASKHGKAALITVDGSAGGVYISGNRDATRADEKWIAKARHDGVRVYRAPGATPENFGYYPGSCFCAGDVIARAKNLSELHATVCSSMATQRDTLAAEIAAEAACRAAADAALQANIDALDASFGEALCAQGAAFREWASAKFVCRGGGLVVGYGSRLEFADSKCATAAAMRFTESPSGGVLSVGSASTAAAMTWMSGNYMSWFSPEFLRLYSGASVVSPTAKIEANPVDAGKIQVSGAPLTLNVAPTASAHAATKGYVDAADAALCARICKIEKCGASSACGLPGVCVDARIEKAVTSEAACRAAADAELQANIDALDASFGEALCAQISELHAWANDRFVCRGGDIVVGPGARLEFAGSGCATAAAMRFTDSPTGGVLSVGSASTAAAMTWMSGNYMSWFSPEFLRLYSGASVVSPTAKIEANPNGVILAVDAGKIQVSGAPLTLNVAPTASAHAATKGYVDAADAEALDALDAESACRKSEILRVDSNFSELTDAVGELTDALDAESVAREKAVGAEAACRAAADACLRRCIGARDSAVRALCGTVASLRTCVNAINTNVSCVYPQIPKICSKLTMISACAARLDSRVAEVEAGGDVDAKIAAEKSCRAAADKKLCAMIRDICLCALDERLCALDERVCALERSTEIDVLRNSINAVDNRVLVLEDELDELDARVEALEQGGGGGGGGGGGDATLAGDNVWTGRNVFVANNSLNGGFVVAARSGGSEMLRVGTSLSDRDDVPMSISQCFVTIGYGATLRVVDGRPIRCGGGVRFDQSQGGFANVHIANRNASSRGRVMIPNPALCRGQWEAVDDAARRDDADEVTSAVVLSNPKSLMIELVTQSEFDAVPAACKTCHSLYFILCGDEPL